MASFNRVILMGNLTRDPQVKYIPSGAAVCDFGIAVNETWKDKSGEKKESVAFVDIKAWARTAEIVGEYCAKGTSVLIEGKLTQDTWDDKTTGQKRSKLLVTAERVVMLGGRGAAKGGAETDASYAPDTGATDPDNPF